MQDSGPSSKAWIRSNMDRFSKIFREKDEVEVDIRHFVQEHVEELNITNGLLNERKEQLEERLNSRDRDLTELKV